MSNDIFPSSLIGYTWDSLKKPLFNNITHSPATGRDIRIALYAQPVFEFSLSNAWLTKADKDSLIGFFMARSGGFDSFLYSDEDCTVTAEYFGTGDGTMTAFQLQKVVGSSLSMVQNLASTPLIYKDAVLQTVGTHYTVSSTGLVSFVTPPANGAVLTWTGSCYYRCVFLSDDLEYNQFANRLYDCDEIRFKGCLANKL